MSVTLENVTRAIDGIPAIRDVSLTPPLPNPLP
jgi:hypothetical protein